MKSKLPIVFAIVILGSAFLIADWYLIRPINRATNDIEAEGLAIANQPLSQPEQEPAKPSWTLQGKLVEASRMLSLSPPLQTVFADKTHYAKTNRGGRRKVKRRRVISHEVAIAILDTQTGQLYNSRYRLDYAEMIKANKLRRRYLANEQGLPRFVPVTPDERFEVVVDWWNEHNSELSIRETGTEDVDRYIVAANKFPYTSTKLAYPEDRADRQYSNIVYIPYSRHLHQSELIEKGRDYLRDQVADVFENLKRLSVESRTFPGLLITDTIEPEFIKNIFLTEQTDPRYIFEATDGGKRLTERVLVRLGTNGDRTFRFTYSKTGALGLAQIMPGTYRLVHRVYPEVGLIDDVHIGRVDMHNAITASVLIFDDHLATVHRRARRSARGRSIFDNLSTHRINEIRAAIYNGGPGKYMPKTGKISRRVTETVDFVRKYNMIEDLNHWDVVSP